VSCPLVIVRVAELRLYPLACGFPDQPVAAELGLRRHEPTSHELTSPDALAQLTRLLTNLPGDVHAVPATAAISRCACVSCVWPAS
jgi:hypothetical protein